MEDKEGFGSAALCSDDRPERAAQEPRKIITSFVYPPIPIRNMDWQAYFDGDEPDDDGRMRCGHGETEQEAINDLLEGCDA